MARLWSRSSRHTATVLANIKAGVVRDIDRSHAGVGVPGPLDGHGTGEGPCWAGGDVHTHVETRTPGNPTPE